MGKKNWSNLLSSMLREYAEALIVAALVALVFRVVFIGSYRMPSDVMSPSILPGDFVLAFKQGIGPHWDWIGKTEVKAKSLDRGKLVIFQCPEFRGQSCVRRLIGLPGDRIEIRKGRLYVNGKRGRYFKVGPVSGAPVFREVLFGSEWLVQAPFSGGGLSYGPVVVPPQQVFLLGDNRTKARDSRVWGPVPMETLVAKPSLIWMSVSWSESKAVGSVRPSFRWPRIFKSLD